MSGETRLLAMLRQLATDPAARGLTDDAAVLEIGGARLVLTHDMLAEGVHFLAADPPEDVAWKLLAINLSDLAAKGARPIGVLLGYSLRGDPDWDSRFIDGFSRALKAFGLALLGGDTVSVAPGDPRSFGLTAIGSVDGPVPSRSGARPGDLLWVSGTIGDARAGLRIARHERGGPDHLLERYRTPSPRLEAGQRLVSLVNAMMDVSDGLLLDTHRLAEASNLSARIELDAVPLSEAYRQFSGDDRADRLSAATAGDDYELLFTAPRDRSAQILALSEELGLPFSRIGEIDEGTGLTVSDAGETIPLPARLGYEHGG